MIPPRASLPCGRCSLCVAPHQVGRPVRLPWSSIWPPCAIAVVRLGFWAWSRVGPRRSSRSGSPLGASPGVGGSRWWRWTVSPVSRALPTRSSHRPGRSWIPTRVVSLAGGKLDEYRCRIQRAITGRRGRAGDRLYRARRTLLTGAGLLTDVQAERLVTLFADDRHAAVQAAWGVYQRPVPGLPHRGFGPGKVPDATAHRLPETDRPRRARGDPDTGQDPDRKSLRHPWPTSTSPVPPTAPRQAINGRLEHLRGIALGFAQPGQLHHPQPHPHRTPQRPPDNNHLNQPISPIYHTLKHEEPV